MARTRRPGITDEERGVTYAAIPLATKDLDDAFARLQASVEVVPEPTEQRIAFETVRPAIPQAT